MFRSFRPFSFFFLFILAFLISGASTTRAAGSDQTRITAAANVTLRTLPAATSPAVIAPAPTSAS